MNKRVWTILLSLIFICVAQGFAATQVGSLTCEYRTNPLGIDAEKPRLNWKIESNERDVEQSAYEVCVATSIKGLSLPTAYWRSGKVLSEESIQIEYDGAPLKSGERLYWRVRVWDRSGRVSRWSDVAWWEMGLLESEQWDGAEWITVKEEGVSDRSVPSQYMRKEFSADKKVKRARLYSTALGTYRIFLNGEKVSEDLFAPGWTSYHKRLQYQSYDVTDMIEKGENTIGVMLADGWYRGKMAWQHDRAYYGDRLAMLAKLVVEYSDGTSEVVVTDDSWMYSYGAIEMSDWYDGESYDARKELTGWNTSGYDAAAWSAVDEFDYPKDHLVATVVELPRVIEELTPVRVFRTPNGDMVADFGQNFVGWVRFMHEGEAGDLITLSFAEVLDKDGNIFNANYRTAKSVDTFTLKGGEVERLEPHFTFHGFQYVKIEGLKELPAADALRGVVVHTPMTKSGEFSTSNDMINQLQSNIVWSQRDNFLEIPTDCPQRDERLGWTGDAQVFCATAMFNYDVANFYTKWLRDLAVDQMEDGSVPHVIPNVLTRSGAAAWADAALIIPWTMYRHYGDKRILAEQYDSMAAWVEYMERKGGESYHWTGDFHYGDWLSNPAAYTDKDLIANAYFYYSTSLMVEIAEVLGREADVKRWSKLAANVKKSFNDYYVTPKGRLMSNTQTAYLMAITFGLLPDDVVEAAKGYLASDVARFKHLTTGFVGTPLLCNALTAMDRDDLAFMLLMRDEFPSWLYPVKMGATTVWERWDAILPDGNFNGGSMNSFNHYSYGAIGEWMYHHITGIKRCDSSPAYKKFALSPHVGGGLTSAKARFESMYGNISSAWRIEDGVFYYDFTIPANSSARVILPSAKSAEVRVDAKVNVEQEGSDAVFTLGSGSYSVSYPYKK